MVSTYATWNGYYGQRPRDFCQGVETIVLKHGRPLIIDIQEGSTAFGMMKDMARELQYDMVWRRGMGVESRSTYLLVAKEVELFRRGALMMEKNWKGPKVGRMHPGRVYPTVVIGAPRQRHTGIHFPPGLVTNRKAFDASLDLLVNKGNRWVENAIWMGDWNMSYRSAMARKLARRLGATIVHDGKESRIDWALVRGAQDASYEAHTKLGSDAHKYGILKVKW